MTAVDTLKQIRHMFGHMMETHTNADLLDGLYDIMQELFRRRDQVNRAEKEHERQALVISELQKTVEEYQLRDGRQEARDARTGGLHRWQKPWNSTRMWEG